MASHCMPFYSADSLWTKKNKQKEIGEGGRKVEGEREKGEGKGKREDEAKREGEDIEVIMFK